MQLLEEELVLLSLAGGVLGIGLAIVIDRALISFLPQGVAVLTLTATPDWRVLGFTLLISVFTGVLFGLAPAIQSTRPQLAGTLKDQAGAVVGGASVGLRKALVVAQVSLSLLLLVASRALHSEPGRICRASILDLRPVTYSPSQSIRRSTATRSNAVYSSTSN